MQKCPYFLPQEPLFGVKTFITLKIPSGTGDHTSPKLLSLHKLCERPYMWQPQVEIVLLSLLLCHEIQLKSQNSNCVNCDYFTQNGS
jgi:hypothetical protein